jgi:hypothetical protein
MRVLLGASALATLLIAAPAYAQFGGGGGGGLGGTGDASAQNLPSTVGIGNHTGNGYYYGAGGGEQPYYSGRSVHRRFYPAPYGYPPYAPY